MIDIDALLDRMRHDDVVSDLDIAFARLVMRYDESGGAPLAAASALASAVSSRGQTSVSIEELAAGVAAWLDGDAAASLGGILRVSPVSGDGSRPTPVVLDEGRVYLYRYWDYERRLAASLAARNRDAPDAPADAWLKGRLDALFPEPADGDVDWQKVAAALAMLRRLTIVSGGPGTGKTTTVVRLLALILEHADEAGCRIALAAPTGKAAARMQQAIESARAALPIDERVRAAIPDAASTIHRLLGARARGGGFRHDVDDPLPVDVLVVDEVSMVDLALLTRLLEAVPGHARIVLMGDRDQLASVEPGSVFADLCAGADGFSGETAARLSRITGGEIAAAATDVLADACVLLKRSYRFGADSGIGRLAAAVNAGDAKAVRKAVRPETHDAVEWLEVEAPSDLGPLVEQRLLSDFAPRLESLSAGSSPAELFALYARFQVLCAVRRGPWGVAALNRMIERALAARGLIDAEDPWYPGRPVMVTVNDYGLGLFNGDIGLILPYPATGEPRACFLPDGGEAHWLHPARLPDHETAWALTVHKSQGSEFDDVLAILPEATSPVLTRELLYTAITRARRRVSLWGPAASLECAVSRRVVRQSSLGRRLADG